MCIIAGNFSKTLLYSIQFKFQRFFIWESMQMDVNFFTLDSGPILLADPTVGDRRKVSSEIHSHPDPILLAVPT
jgi:hypothetical protein